MSINRRAPTSKTGQYTRSYRSMRGIDLSPTEASIGLRYAYAENMYRDYEAGDGDAIESIPGFRRIFSGTDKINGLFLQRTADGETYVIVHHGIRVLRFKPGEPEGVAQLSGTPYITDTESFAFTYGGDLYLSNGAHIYKITDGGELRPVLDGLDTAPYIPTVYKNGREAEERNLMTARFIETTELAPVSDYAYGSHGLRYRITSAELSECAVSGISDGETEVFIPGRVILGDKYYTVTEIDTSAFSGNTSIVSVTLSDTVKRIGNGAFFGCSALERIISGDGLLEIGDSAFASSALDEIYIPAGFLRFGDSSLPSGCTVLYELGVAGFENIEGTPGTTVKYGRVNRAATLGIRLITPTESVKSVTADGEPLSYTALTDSEGLVTEIVISVEDKSSLTGVTVSITADMAGNLASPSEAGQDLSVLTAKKNIYLYTVIRSCTRAVVSDGRVFVWGHPEFPSTVFFSKRGRDHGGLYFGSLDYITEGDGESRVVSVLGLPDGIAVFTEADDSGESIYFHTATDGEGMRERLYPVSEIHSGDGAVGEAVSFGDDRVFLSKRGLMGIEEKPLYLSRSVNPRSSAVNAALLHEDLSSATLAVWRGYLAVSVGGRIYLADSRASYNGLHGKEYEWFLLSNIGSWRGDSRVYRYASVAKDGYLLSDTPDGVAEGTVYSEDIGDGLVYYVLRGDSKLEVYPTEEMTGGDFYPAERLLSFDGLLMFSTDCGDVCVFNSDMRGIAPERLSSSEDFDPEEYSAVLGDAIHSDFYDFAGHAPRYTLTTAPDDCGLPHMAKSTVGGSLAIKLKCFVGSRVTCRVSTDGTGYLTVGECDAGITDMSELSFASLPFAVSKSAAVMPDERCRGWLEKSISLCSEGFRSPMGVYSISYRYRVTGKPKKL